MAGAPLADAKAAPSRNSSASDPHHSDYAELEAYLNLVVGKEHAPKALDILTSSFHITATKDLWVLKTAEWTALEISIGVAPARKLKDSFDKRRSITKQKTGGSGGGSGSDITVTVDGKSGVNAGLIGDDGTVIHAQNVHMGKSEGGSGGAVTNSSESAYFVITSHDQSNEFTRDLRKISKAVHLDPKSYQMIERDSKAAPTDPNWNCQLVKTDSPNLLVCDS